MVEAHEFGVRVDDLCDTFTSESLFPEAPLDVIQYLRVCRVGLVQQILQRKIRRTKPVAEMLREDPSAVYAIGMLTRRVLKTNITEHTCIDGLLDCVSARSGAACVEEGIVG